MELLFVGYQGDEGARLILETHRQALEKRFSGAYLASLESCSPCAEKAKIEAVLQRTGATFRECEEGGILRTLFEFAKEEKCGITVDENKIPVHQETVELCELYDLNPYTIASHGSYLVVGCQPGIIGELATLGVRVEVIGETVPGKKKTLLRYGEEQCLNRPKQDPLKDLEKD